MNTLIFTLFFASIWVFKKFTWNVKEGAIEQRECNPNLIQKGLTYMRKGLNNMPSRNTKTECFLSELMVLFIITTLREEKFFSNT